MMPATAGSRTPVEVVVDALHAKGRKVTQRGAQFDAQCPNEAAHKKTNGPTNKTA